MMPMDKEYLIKQWLADKLTDQELDAFQKLEDYQLNLEVVQYAKMFKAPKFSTSEHFDKLQPYLKNQPKNPARRLWVKQYLRIAGILIIGLAVYYFYPANDLVQIQTTIGEKTTIELPDASVVIVNAASKITYDNHSWERNKQVNLQGEAFFNVVTGGSFEVVTPKGVISVLGTKFNIKQRGKFFEVKCFEGVVRVTSDQFVEELKAGDNLRSVDGELSRGINTFESPQWTSNISSFQNAPFSEVLAELERQYAISINTEKVAVDRLFTGGFVHNDLKNALISITEPLNLKYRLDTPKKVTITPL